MFAPIVEGVSAAFLWLMRKGHQFIFVWPRSIGKGSSRRLSKLAAQRTKLGTVVRVLLPRPRRNFILRSNAGPRHNETSTHLSRTSLSLTVFSLFCLLSLTAPDAKIVARNSTILLPIADVEVLFPIFILAGPAVLIALSVITHVLVRNWYEAGGRHRAEPKPYIFNTNRFFPQLISFCIWYVQTPAVLLLFTFRALPRSWEFYSLAVATAVFSLYNLYRSWKLERRACGHWSNEKLKGDTTLFLQYLAISVLLCILAIGTDAMLVRYKLHGYDKLRPMYLVNAQLQGQDLQGVELVGARMSDACLRYTNLQGADLRNADLGGADLRGANLHKALLGGVNLKGADIRGIRGLPCTPLRGLNNWQSAYRDPLHECGQELLPIPPDKEKLADTICKPKVAD